MTKISKTFLIAITLSFMVFSGCAKNDDDHAGTNNSPVANAGLDQMHKLGDIQLNGTGSMDPDNNPITYQWTVTAPDGTLVALDNNTLPEPRFAAFQIGTYTAQLVVNDGETQSDPDVSTVKVTLTGENTPPVAEAGNPIVVKKATSVTASGARKAGFFTFLANAVSNNTTIELDASKSYDPDRDNLSFEWSVVSITDKNGNDLFSDVTCSSENPTSHAPIFVLSSTDAPEILVTFQLEVTDDEGRKTKDTLIVLVNDQGPPALKNKILNDNIEIVSNKGNCYLANYADDLATGCKNKKQLLYLEGNAYERGYAEGSLCPEGAYRMTHDYVDNYVKGLVGGFGVPTDQIPQELLDTVKDVLLQAVLSQEYAVPEEYIQEMQGIADGCQDQGYDVAYEDVLLINIGFDILYSLIYQGGSLACNELSVFGNATIDGRIYHGRDFMFSTGGDVFSDEAIVMVFNPTIGYPFVSASVPGFVGFPTGMNINGVSMGMDMVPNRQNRALVTGIGTLLMCRDVTQFASNLEDAIQRIRNTSRGVSWLFQVSDPTNAAALETVANKMVADQDDLIATLGSLIPGIGDALIDANQQIPFKIIDKVGNEATTLTDELSIHPEDGVAVRYANYDYPDELDNYALSITVPADNPVAHGTADQTIISPFPPQIENYNNFVGMSNHYILPEMNTTQMGLFYHTIDTQQGGGQESEWRYRTMLGPILPETNQYHKDPCYYGAIDYYTAMWLIDFLNPNDQDRSGGFYGSSITQSVGGHHVLIDNKSAQMWVLHGYYNEPWVPVDLKEILRRVPLEKWPPIAIAGNDQIVDINTPVTFDGSKSYDPYNRTIQSYTWDFGDNVSATGDKVMHSYSRQGKYSVTLTVVAQEADNKEVAGRDMCEITVMDFDADSDNDGLTNGEELANGTDYTNTDTDGDGLTDGEEVNTNHTDPLKTDGDRDGVGDKNEIQQKTDPNDPNDKSPLIVNAGRDRIIELDKPVTLNGSWSDADLQRSAQVEYLWTIKASPQNSSPTFTNENSATPAFTSDPDYPGEYILAFRVKELNGSENTDEIRITTLCNPILDDNAVPVASYRSSYLAEYKTGPNQNFKNPKQFLYLEGNAYDRGYAEGYLCPDEVAAMAHDYVDNVVFELTGIPGSGEDYSYLWTLVKTILIDSANNNIGAVPEEFQEEMHGIADGCQDQGVDVTFEELVTINSGFDMLESLYMNFGAIFSCNEFGVFGSGLLNSLTGGKLFHGRDFMFPTGGDSFSDVSLLMVHKPTNGHPFVAAAVPGFVGIPTGLNTQGVSCGMDVVYSVFSRPAITGMGTLLLCRSVVQFADNMDEGIDIITNADRGVPWLYMIADGKIPDAVVLETEASTIAPPGTSMVDYLCAVIPGLGDTFTPYTDQLQIIDETGAPVAEGDSIFRSAAGDMNRGVMLRRSTYTDPERIEMLGMQYLSAEAQGPMTAAFPSQQEAYNDLVAMTNHYIIPQMVISNPSFFYGSYYGDSSGPRYDQMMGLLNGAYGNIDRIAAMWIIDFLNPSHDPWYYGPDKTQSVKGHHILMDNQSLEMWALHGYYNEAWMHVDLNKVLAGTFLENMPPVAAITGENIAEEKTEVEFNASESYDPDGSSLSYIWDFGDGVMASGQTVTHTYSTAGEYLVRLTAKDSEGAIGYDTVKIIVAPTDKPAREAEPIVMTGAQLPGWSSLAAVGFAYPWPVGTGFNNYGGDSFVWTDIRDAHAGGAIIEPPEELQTGVEVEKIAAFKWVGYWVEIPVQVDELFPYFLTNAHSDFGIYSASDYELTYEWDAETWNRGDDPTKLGYDPSQIEHTEDPVSTLDNDDEIVFMASDAGDKAPPDAVGPSASRQEIAITDPLDPTNVQYVYLFLVDGGSSFDASNGYVRFERDNDADQWIDQYSFDLDDFTVGSKYGNFEQLGVTEVGNVGYGPNIKGDVYVSNRDGYKDQNGSARYSDDRFLRDSTRVKTQSYKWHVSGRWMVREMHIAEPGQRYIPLESVVYGDDLIDRWKGRAFQQSPDSMMAIITLENEQTNWEANSCLLGYRTGPVRAIREVWGADSGTNLVKRETFYRDAICYRFYVRVHPMPPDGIYTNWDYNANAVAKYYNSMHPEGVNIDGIPDDVGQISDLNGYPVFDLPDPTFDIPYGLYRWEQIAGKENNGSLVYSWELKGITGLSEPLIVPFYCDDKNIDDGTGDDPGLRPWPGLPLSDTRVQKYYVDNPDAKKQGAYGSHGLHVFFTSDTDNAFVSPVPATEADIQQWQFAVPTQSPHAVGESYAQIVRTPLVAISTSVPQM